MQVRAGDAAADERLTEVRDELARWRKQRPRGARIPEVLWSAALTVAREHGVSKTAIALRLDYYSLKRRLAGEGENHVSPGSFVELRVGNLLDTCSESVLEMADANGTRLRVVLRGTATAETAAVARALCGATR